MIVADTGAVISLIDADDQHHDRLVDVYQRVKGSWILPWAILPEVDYLLTTHLSPRVETAFLDDIAMGSFTIDWGQQSDLQRARDLNEAYADLELGLVDTIVIATAERLRADSIATLDVRDFSGVRIEGAPRLIPRDL